MGGDEATCGRQCDRVSSFACALVGRIWRKVECVPLTNVSVGSFSKTLCTTAHALGSSLHALGSMAARARGCRMRTEQVSPQHGSTQCVCT